MNEPFILNADYISRFIKPRARDCNKGDFGRLLIVASCLNMSGAISIATRAALRSGAGLVFAASSASALMPVRINTPEAVLIPLAETKEGQISFKNADLLIEKANSCSALVLGCGLSVCGDTEKLVKKLITSVNVPIVLDADGINIIAKDINILKNTAAPIIITPHLKEMSRLCGKDVDFIKSNKESVAAEFSKEYGVTLILKDFETVVSDNNGRLFRNFGGHPCMAKGGSGDMLSGMIGAFLAQGIAPLDAACCAVFMHARAGEICGEEMGCYSVLASDLTNVLYKVFKEIL